MSELENEFFKIETFRLLLENISDITTVIDQQGVIRYASPSVQKVLGYEPQEIVGKNFAEFTHPEELGIARAMIQKAFASVGTVERAEFRFRHKDGSWRFLDSVGKALPVGAEILEVVTSRNHTYRKQIEEKLRGSEENLRLITENMFDMVSLTDTTGRFLYVSPAHTRTLGYKPGGMIGSPITGFVHPEDLETVNAAIDRARAGPGQERIEFRTRHAEGHYLWVEATGNPILDEHGMATGVVISVREISERKRAEEERQVHAQQLALLYDAGLALNSVLEPRDQLEFLFQIAKKALHADRCEFFRFDASRGGLVLELGSGLSEESNESLREVVFPAGEPKGIDGWVYYNRLPQYVPDVLADPRYIPIFPEVRSGLWVPVEREQQVRGVLSALSTRPDAFTAEHERLLVLFANQAAVALENARLFGETRQRLNELEAINRISTALREAQSLDEMLPRLLDETLAVVGTTAGSIWLAMPTGTQQTREIARGWFEQISKYFPQGEEGLAFYVLKTGQPYRTSDLKVDPRVRESVRAAIPENWSGACIPIRTTNETVGALFVAVPLPRILSDQEIKLLMTLAEIAGNAIHRAKLYEETERQVRHLAALHTIDRAISASFDLKFSLNVILDQVIQELGVDAADVLMFDPLSQKFEYSASRGFRTDSLKHSSLQLGEGLAGRAALKRQVVSVPDLRVNAGSLALSKPLPGEEFVAYYAAPLLAKGKMKGVLEVFHRQRLSPDSAWLSLLETLASQLAIAVDDAGLFVELQRANAELALAYDTTIEGWSRAMDLRDKETEGHTLRVTEMTVRLGRSLGLTDDELVHVRRGALLHDIGNMGVPDGILLKPEPLTDEEWRIMRMHPVYAYELLSPITYLKSALDIPHSHHEKWDGTGYPRGLKGEQIPLAARIFAVVDVWDALRSDRPYRKSWSEEKARDYIRSESGSHFDPNLVEIFLGLT